MTTYNIWQMILQENRVKFLQKIEKWLLINTFKMLMQANLQIWNRAGAIYFVDNCLCDRHIWRLFVDLVYHTTPGGGCFWEILVGVCCPVLQIQTLFQTQKCHFPHSFSDLASNIIGSHSDLKLLRLEHQQKDVLKSISNSHIIFLS